MVDKDMNLLNQEQPTPPKALRNFQLTLGKYLRSPESETLPKGIKARRAQVYEELLINNVRGFLNTCFPVCKSLIKAEQWSALTRAFFRDWRGTSPFFKDIPEEFLMFLQQSKLLQEHPPWFFELAHYEWIELHLETAKSEPYKKANANTLSVNEPLVTLAYQWPVHRISAEFQPEVEQATYLFVYRNQQNKVLFNEANAATNLLLESIKNQPMTTDMLFANLAEQLQMENNEQFQQFCAMTVEDLINKSVITLTP